VAGWAGGLSRDKRGSYVRLPGRRRAEEGRAGQQRQAAWRAAYLSSQPASSCNYTSRFTCHLPCTQLCLHTLLTAVLQWGLHLQYLPMAGLSTSWALTHCLTICHGLPL